MKKISKRILALPLNTRAEIALKAAVRKAIERHANAGLPIHILRKDKHVTLSASQLRKRRKRK